MKLKKLFILMLVLLMIASTLHVTVAAEESENEIQPRLSNVFTYMVDFDITSTGFVSVCFDYQGKTGITTGAISEIYLEKRFLGIFWSRVDIGTADDVWVDTFSGTYGYVDHTFQLEKTGTYRAKFKITFTGTNTDDDVVEETIEASYG